MNSIFREGSTFDFTYVRVNPKIVAIEKKKIESPAKNCEWLWINCGSFMTLQETGVAVLSKK